jgi:RNA polymerase sigma-70 factor, ECF subfamily
VLPAESQRDRDDRSEEFVSLLKRHERRLNGYVLSLVYNWADADDVLQEVVVALWRQFDNFDPTTDFGSWACAVAYYHVLSYRKRVKRRRLRFSDDVDRLLDQEIAAVAKEFSDYQDVLGECLDKLGESERAFLQDYYSGTPIAELAKRFSRSAASLYKDLSGLRRALRACVDRALGEDERNP